MLLYRTQFDDGGEEIWPIRRQRPLPARLAVVVPPNAGGPWKMHQAMLQMAQTPGSGPGPLPGPSENSRFGVRLDQFSTGHQRWVVPPPPAWLVTAVGDEWTIPPRHYRRIEFCKAAHTDG